MLKIKRNAESYSTEVAQGTKEMAQECVSGRQHLDEIRAKLSNVAGLLGC